MDAKIFAALDKDKWSDLADLNPGDPFPPVIAERYREYAHKVYALADLIEKNTPIDEIAAFDHECDEMKEKLDIVIAVASLVIDGEAQVLEIGDKTRILVPNDLPDEDLELLKLTAQLAERRAHRMAEELKAQANKPIPGQYL